MSFGKFSVNNSVLVNIITIVVFLAGFFAIFKIPLESFPSVQFNEAYIVATYPGASPSEIEGKYYK